VTSEALLSVVIPVYLSEAFLARTVSELVGVLENTIDFEIVLVNDGSPDGVQGIIDDLCRRDRRIRQVSLAHNVGQHRATLRGLARARGGIVVTVDDDGQNPPSAVLAVAGALRERDVDVVYGRFQVVEQSFARRMASRANRWLSKMTIANDKQLAITNVRAIRGDLARWLGSTESAYPYIDALVFRATSRVAETPVDHRPRLRGNSTYTFGKLVRLWMSHVTTLTILPLQVAVVGSFGASAVGFLVGVVQMWRVLHERRAPEGWLSLFCGMTFLFSLLFAFLGIISSYLGRMYVSTNERGLVWERPRPKHHSDPAVPSNELR
jgi:polyisoprenyl-phosphate glycosyltransferase